VFDGNPLVALPPKEVPLEKAPLVRVIAQVRFPSILSIGEASFVAAFQEHIRRQYPILQPEQTRSFFFGDQGLESTSPTSMVWRFIDKTEKWRVSLASNFVTLETTDYLSRADFLQRFKEILIATDTHIKPQVFERLGLRYIARLIGQDVDQLTRFLRPEVSGVLASEIAVHAEQSINDSFFTLPDQLSQIHSRWGRFPANVTIDPTAIEPVPESSWVIDLDMFTTPFVEVKAFEVEPMMNDAQSFAERLYTFFRWAVTKDFLLHFGGEV
jgi:uncharacterized protein (TIGR04255 family)